MFTGLIKGTGVVIAKQSGTAAASLQIRTGLVTVLQLGDSIGVNGVCLTATRLGRDWFLADILPETWKGSNLSLLTPGAPVNLEPALKLGDPFGGHLVSGHVDGLGKVTGLARVKNALLVTVSVAPGLARQMVLKGSVAIDGISLTIQKLTGAEFTVSLIPHTVAATTLSRLKSGQMLNIETDLLAKYTLKEREVSAQSGARPEISEAFLAEHGFIR